MDKHTKKTTKPHGDLTDEVFAYIEKHRVSPAHAVQMVRRKHGISSDGSYVPEKPKVERTTKEV